MRSFLYLVLLGAVLITIGIGVRSGLFMRKNPGEPINAAMRIALEENAYDWPAADAAILAQKYAGAMTTKDDMRYIIVKPGEGTEHPKKGQIVQVNYEGRFLDGTKFDASADHGGPFNFPVGLNKVIPGWDQAVLDMTKGEKRTIVVPYWLAYGEKGIRTKIPPKATLVFDIELLDFR